MDIDLSKYPEIYRDLIDKGATAIVETVGLSEEQARAAVYCITEIIRRDWAGTQPYFSKGLAYEVTRRDREMYEKFNGSNHAALAREYDISVRQVYERINIIREEEFRRRQPALFEG